MARRAAVLRSGWRVRPASLRTLPIRMLVADIDRARDLAGKKGIGCHAYMKMLLHEALNRKAGKLQ